ncbi:glycoside hydrolase family 43 protein [Thermophagus xiamenensis]|jgi:beta-galactosidase|uniref:Beta-galactosidase n=1 Tax=Thermophagus xiamenensis TaxID=385682 RepID=A0A1I2A3I1_9BACT|nr:glycoside hydrolase family 43 protein [Thermophagus xiamenensis]SFE38347.1 beta-galactosidase [Thermophagus xiamenensis]
MKRFIILQGVLAFLFSLTGCLTAKEPVESVYLFSYFKGNGDDGLHLAYSTDALNWFPLNDDKPILAPEVGKDSLMRDPCIIQGNDGLFHMVWTTGWTDPYIGYASSPDLINWSKQKIIPVMGHEPKARNCWAPEIFYDPNDDHYLIFWATTIPGRHSDIDHGGKESGYNHRMYYVKTKDFNNFSETQIFFNPDFSVIDCTILERHGKFFMFLKNENPNPPEKNIRITVADDPEGPFPTVVSKPITGNYWAEGPTTLVKGDSVYVFFDKYREHKYGAIRSGDMVNWEDISEKISFPAGTRHGTAFKVDKAVLDKLFIAFKN